LPVIQDAKFLVVGEFIEESLKRRLRSTRCWIA